MRPLPSAVGLLGLLKVSTTRHVGPSRMTWHCHSEDDIGTYMLTFQAVVLLACHSAPLDLLTVDLNAVNPPLIGGPDIELTWFYQRWSASVDSRRPPLVTARGHC
ncbi:hypothetical protein Tco_1490496 [Tanacetum coccineum]